MADPIEVIARAIERGLPYSRGKPPAGWQEATWAYACEAMARGALAALEAEGMMVDKGWEPIETAPKDGVIDLWADGLRWPDCYWVEGTTGYWTCQGVGPIDNPTHWMRLPEPPEPRP